MRIGELAKRADVSRDTIRFYERHGLIRSKVDPGSDNTYRIYPEDAVLTLDVIRDAQAAGLSVADITIFLGQFLGQGPEADVQAFLDQHITQITRRLKASKRFLQMLKDTKTALARAPQDGLDEIGKAGAGSRNLTNLS